MKPARYLIFLTLAATAHAEDARLKAAEQAMSEGLPQVAIHELSDQTWSSKDEEQKSNLLRARALLAAGRTAEALSALGQFPADNLEAQFWLAQAQAALGNIVAALPIYQRLAAEKDFPRQSEAIIGAARMLNSSGRAGEATLLLSEVSAPSNAVILELAELQLDSGDATAAQKTLSLLKAPDIREQQKLSYLEGRTALALGNVDDALAKFQSITHPPSDIAGAWIVAQSECFLRQKKTADSEKVLENFIEENPRYVGLGEVFAGLDRVYSVQVASSSAELRRWSDDASQPDRAAWALYYLARNEARLSKTDNSEQAYRDFLAKYPGHPLASEAMTALASDLMTAGDPKGALDILAKGDGSQVHYLRGLAFAKLQSYPQAAGEFLKVTPPDIDAVYNSAVCAMLSGTADDKNTAIPQLRRMEGGARLLEKFQFVSAMFQASKRQPDAAQMLRALADSDSRYANRARLALAEIEGIELNTKAAQHDLRLVSLNDAGAKERAACLEIFLADIGEPESEGRVVALANAFLKEYPKSSFEPEVRMKIGEMLFRKGDYLGAREQFDIISHNFPDSQLTEKAMFLAAQAVSRSMNPNAMEEAIDIYEQVVKLGGPFAVKARFAQALLQNALNRPQEAIGILDSILSMKIDTEMRNMALIEKGETYFAQGGSDPANYQKAIETWTEVAGTPATPKQWRNQALTRMGAADEKLGKNDAALACYYQVLQVDQKNEPEYFWFYKAGFNAGKLLESQKLWKEAIAIYEKMAAIEGPRAEEAKSRANNIRLENFLWEN